MTESYTKPLENTNNSSQVLESNIVTISEIELPRDVSVLIGIFNNTKIFSSYEVIISDSINKKTGIKINNGISEMVACKYTKGATVDIDIRVCSSVDFADKWYKLEHKNSKGVYKEFENQENKYFISHIEEKGQSDTFTRVGFQKGSTVIFLSEYKKSSEDSNLNFVLETIKNGQKK